MSPNQRLKRLNAVKVANALNKIEGVPVSQYAIELFSKHLCSFPELSATIKMLSEHLISTNSVGYNSIYGILCGCKKHRK